MDTFKDFMHRIPFDPYSSLNQRIVDALIGGVSLWISYQAIFEARVPPELAVQMWILIPAVMAGHVFIHNLLGTYRLVWRYVSLQDVLLLARNSLLLAALLTAFHIGSVGGGSLVKVPFGVIVLWTMLSLVGGFGARVCRRLQYEQSTVKANGLQYGLPVLLIGAGRLGLKTAKELHTQPDFRPIGFLDDDPLKAGLLIGGLRVIAPLDSLETVVQEYGVRQVVVCIEKPPREALRRVWATSDLLGISVKVVPRLEEILHGNVSVANFRDVNMNDLLGREVIAQPPSESTMATYRGRRILVTGGGGSIGSELALQLSKLGPEKLVLLDKDENGLNDTCVYLRQRAGVEAIPVVADLRFAERLRAVFETIRPEIVFHAAAHKHVHLMETNPCEAVTNNVTGTRNLVERSVACGVSRFVQISTDKAAQPTSIMGASKRVCEMVVQAHEGRDPTLFSCVRFGNVLGSRGSVVPIFQRQIMNGGPVTVTHPDAKRFLMTIPEAVCLVIQAGTLAHGKREIFVLDMGEPVLIKKLAQDLIELSGLSPNLDVKIEITGMKPGEKLTEVLLDESREHLRPTSCSKIQTIAAQSFDVTQFADRLRRLEKAAWDGDADEVRRNLVALNMGFLHEESKRAWPGNFRAPSAASRVPAASVGL